VALLVLVAPLLVLVALLLLLLAVPTPVPVLAVVLAPVSVAPQLTRQALLLLQPFATAIAVVNTSAAHAMSPERTPDVAISTSVAPARAPVRTLYQIETAGSTSSGLQKRCGGNLAARPNHHQMLAERDRTSESGTTSRLSTAGSPVRTVVYRPSNQWEYCRTSASVAVQPVRKMTRGESTEKAVLLSSIAGMTRSKRAEKASHGRTL
jgi:hypothetical protein